MKRPELTGRGPKSGSLLDASRDRVAALSALVPLAVLLAITVAQHQLAKTYSPSPVSGAIPDSSIFFEGMIQGITIGLIAVGIALLFRTNRAINFAQADLGQLPAVFAGLLIITWGWNFYIALGIGLVGSLVLGVVVEFVFVRRFFKAPRLILTVATIGISQILTATALFLSNAWKPGGTPSIDPPFTITFHVGQTAFGAWDLITIIAAPTLLISLALFLRLSATGVALRGAAESTDRALLLGIPVRRLHSTVWAIAALLAFVAMFLRGGRDGFGLGIPLDATALLAALAAATIGRMERLPTIMLSAIGIGIVSVAVKSDWDRDPYRDLAITLVIITALLIYRPRTNRRTDLASSWQAIREVRPIPKELRSVREIRIARFVGYAVIAAAVLAVGLWLPIDRLRQANYAGIFAIIGISLVVLTGWAGQVSLGQMAVAGIGGAVAASLTTRLTFEVDLAVALIVGGIAGALALTIIGLPALRSKGLTLGISTLALSVLTLTYLLNTAYSPFASWLPDFGAAVDRQPRPPLLGVLHVESERSYFALIVACVVLSIVAVRGLRRSRAGRVIVAARENQRAAEAYGVRTARTTLVALATSGFLAGLAGALLLHLDRDLIPSFFSPAYGLQVFTMVVVGGLGSVGGAVLGAVFVRIVSYSFTGDLFFLSYFATGAGMLIVLMIVPSGLGAALGDLRDGGLRWFARRKGIRVPSLLADTLVETPAPGAGHSGANGESDPLAAAAIIAAADLGQELMENT